jgi:iron complex transport system substrate-binding protein
VTSRALALGALAAGLLLSACGSSGEQGATEAQDEEWSYASGDGKTYTLDKRPTRIIAHAYAAAALMEFGIKPVGVYADGPIKDDVGLRGVDFSGATVLSETWGKIDVEKAATLRPDLIVGDWWPAEKAYSGMEGGVEAKSKKMKELAPVVGPSQGSSIVSLVEGYERLAESLGADVDAGEAGKAKDEFDEAVDTFTDAAKGKPGLTALAISPYDGKYAVAVPKYAPELLDFQRWGLKVIDPRSPDKEFPYWETLSMEKVDAYQPDLLLFDDRNYPGNLKELRKAPTAGSIKAFEAKAYTTWPAYWLHTYSAYAEQLDQLTQAIDRADPDLT